MNLFEPEDKIKIIELNNLDIIKKSPNYSTALQLISSHEQNYPDIENWFKTKVVPGIKTGERGVYLGFHNDNPIASAVVKKGEEAKFCHLHINEMLRNQNIGDIFFLLMAACTRRYAKNVHFTLPEGLWENKSTFFKSYGFTSVRRHSTQYRAFEEELTASTSFNNLWSHVISKVPTLINQFTFPIDSPLRGLIMSIQPQFTEKIMSGEKKIEIRKKFNAKWKDHKVSLYSTSPSKKLMGYATIQNVIKDNPRNIWTKFSSGLGCTKLQFDNYTNGLSEIYAISFSNIIEYSNPLTLSNLSHMCEKRIFPPQSYSTIEKDENWKIIISIAEMMEGRFAANPL
jgi:predicted transcriptional regulator